MLEISVIKIITVIAILAICLTFGFIVVIFKVGSDAEKDYENETSIEPHDGIKDFLNDNKSKLK